MGVWKRPTCNFCDGLRRGQRNRRSSDYEPLGATPPMPCGWQGKREGVVAWGNPKASACWGEIRGWSKSNRCSNKHNSSINNTLLLPVCNKPQSVAGPTAPSSFSLNHTQSSVAGPKATVVPTTTIRKSTTHCCSPCATKHNLWPVQRHHRRPRWTTHNHHPWPVQKQPSFQHGGLLCLWLTETPLSLSLSLPPPAPVCML